MSKRSRKEGVDFKIPSPDILFNQPQPKNKVNRKYIEKTCTLIEKTLLDSGAEGKVVHVSTGPAITRFEIKPAPGVKVKMVLELHNNLARAIGNRKISVVSIPEKCDMVAIDLPNNDRQVVYFKHILTSKEFRETSAGLPVIIGTDIAGVP